MNKTMQSFLLTLFLVSFTAVAPAQPDFAFLDKTTNEQGITYISGGVGAEERSYLKEIRDEFNLKCVFAEHSGNYLANIMVLITDEKGNILIETVSRGPWFLARMPANTYEITVIHENRKKRKTVKLREKAQKTVHFQWK